MFWRKKEAPATSKQALILNAYLTGGMVFLSSKTSSPAARASLQVFILGMADMLRQVENLSWEEFFAVYESTLSEHKLLPSTPVEAFVKRVGKVAATNTDIESVIRQGAQSIRMYVAERDANAPTDLFGAVLFAEKHASSFAQLQE